MSLGMRESSSRDPNPLPHAMVLPEGSLVMADAVPAIDSAVWGAISVVDGMRVDFTIVVSLRALEGEVCGGELMSYPAIAEECCGVVL